MRECGGGLWDLGLGVDFGIGFLNCETLNRMYRGQSNRLTSKLKGHCVRE